LIAPRGLDEFAVKWFSNRMQMAFETTVYVMFYPCPSVNVRVICLNNIIADFLN
jgi:hypothetical protein